MSHGYLNLPIPTSSGSGSGDVVGPGSSTANAITTYADGTGQLITEAELEIVGAVLSGIPVSSGPSDDTVISGADNSDGGQLGGNLVLRPGLDTTAENGDGVVIIQQGLDDGSDYENAIAVTGFGIEILNEGRIGFHSSTAVNDPPTMVIRPGTFGSLRTIDIQNLTEGSFPTLRVVENGQILVGGANIAGTSFVANIGWAVSGAGDIGKPFAPRYIYSNNTVNIGGGSPILLVDADVNLVMTPGAANVGHILWTGSGGNIGAASETSASGPDYRFNNLFMKGTLVLGNISGFSPPYGLNNSSLAGIILAGNGGSASTAVVGANSVFNGVPMSFLGFGKDGGFANVPAFNNSSTLSDTTVYFSILHKSSTKTDLVSFDGSNGAITSLSGSGGFLNGRISPAYARETSSTTITIGNYVSCQLVDYGSLQASGTITLPAAPVDGQEVSLGSGTNGITALTLQANAGQTLTGAITTLVVGTFARYKYALVSTTWYRIG